MKKLCSIRGNVKAVGGYWFIGGEKTTTKKTEKELKKDEGEHQRQT